MLDDGALRRLAEIGIDVYAPRARASARAALAADRSESEAAATLPAGESASVSGVFVLADTRSPEAGKLVDAVRRVFAFAGVGCEISDRAEEGAISEAAAIVAFGAPLARAAGAVLPTTRQREIGWIAAEDAALIARSADAKRALWSELRRILRDLRARGR